MVASFVRLIVINIRNQGYKVKMKIKYFRVKEANKIFPPVIEPNNHRLRDMIEKEMSKTTRGVLNSFPVEPLRSKENQHPIKVDSF